MDPILLGLADRARGFRFVRGSLVADLQAGLAEQGFLDGTPDGIFGNDTADALRAWQRTTGRDQTASLTPGDFAEITGTPAEPFQVCLQITADFEGHGFGKAEGDFDGALITWGIIGFTFFNGELPKLITEIDQADSRALDRSFGPLADDLRHGMSIDPRADRVAAKSWVQGISRPERPKQLLPNWVAAFAKLGENPTARRLQLDRAREKYWKRAEKDADRLGLTGMPGLALCFDIAVQNGGVSSNERSQIAAKLGDESGVSQQTRRETVANVVAENGGWVEDVRSRKLTIARGGGRVHGSDYDLSVWGLFSTPAGAAPATTTPSHAQPQPQPQPKPAAPPAGTTGVPLSQEARFDAFFAALDLRFFTPDEFRYLGATNSNPDKVGHGFGLNHLPDEGLWHAMIPTARIIDRLRGDLGAPIRLTNIYRSPAYNAAVGGALHSQHVKFTAIDFYCSDGQGPADWARALQNYRRAGDFKGGIGVYPSRNFVHLDTRGQNVDFAPEGSS